MSETIPLVPKPIYFFLDIDGVFNNRKSMKKHIHFSSKLAERFSIWYIQMKDQYPNQGFVPILSSTWRRVACPPPVAKNMSFLFRVSGGYVGLLFTIQPQFYKDQPFVVRK